MSHFFNVSITFFNVDSYHRTMLSLATYLNIILLFMAYCDTDKLFSRTKVARCLALVDFCGALFSQVTPNAILSRTFDGWSAVLSYEICFLLFERLMFNVNTNLLKLTQNRLSTAFQNGLPARNSFRDTLRDNVFYHGLTLLLSLVLVTLLFPDSVPMPLVFRSVMRDTLLRGVFFFLDGVVIYSVNALPGPTDEKVLNI